MSNIECLDILTARVDSLETIIFGNDKRDNNITNKSISNRIENIATSINTFEKDIPSIHMCRQLTDELEPIIIQSKLNLNQVNDKIIEVLVSKQDIENSLVLLGEINDFNSKGVIEHEISYDIPKLKTRLEEIDSLLETLTMEANKQSQELNSFLDLYENSISCITTIFSKWQEELILINKKKNIK